MQRLSQSQVLAVVVIGVAFAIALRPAIDNDLWWHLSTGRWILDHKSLPTNDPFSFVRPEAVHSPTDWLAHVMFAALWPWGGRTTLAIVTACLASIGIGLIYLAARATPATRAGTSILAAMAASYFWAARAQMFSFVLTAVVLVVLQKWREQPAQRTVWWLVPLFAAWANLHGAVIYGFLILGSYIAGESANRWIAAHQPAGIRGRGAVVPVAAITRLATVAVACVGAAALNPTGPRILVEPFLKGSASVTYIQEWQPPSLAEPATWPFYLMLVLTIAVVAFNWRGLDATEVLLVGITAVLGLRIARAVSLFAQAGALALARNATTLVPRFSRNSPQRQPERVAVGGTSTRIEPAVALLVFVMVGASVVYAAATKIDPATVAAKEKSEYPVAAIEWIRANRPGRELFNSYDWGGYLTWALPDYPVVIDGRNDKYGDFLDTYAATISAREGWDSTLRELGIQTLLLKPNEPLAKVLRTDLRWRLAYEDPVAVIFTSDR